MTRHDAPQPSRDEDGDTAQAAALDRAWDALAAPSIGPPDPTAMTSGRAQTLKLVHALATAPRRTLSPDVRSRVWLSTRHRAGIPAAKEERMALPPSGSTSAASIAARLGIQPLPSRSVSWRAPGRRRQSFWPALQVVAAAALILALVATVINSQHHNGLNGFDTAWRAATPTVSDSAQGTFTSGRIVTALPDTPKGEGHHISLTRITLPHDTSLTLDPGASHVIRWDEGSYDVAVSGQSPSYTVARPSVTATDLNGAIIRAHGNRGATFTLLTISRLPDRSLPSRSGITVRELVGYDTHFYVGDQQINVLLSRGSAEETPGPFPELDNPRLSASWTDSRAQAVLYAEHGAIRVNTPKSPANTIESGVLIPASDPAGVTLEQGQSALLTPDGENTLQQATPGNDAVYTLLVLSPVLPSAASAPPATAASSGGLPASVSVHDTLPENAVIDFRQLTLRPNGSFNIPFPDTATAANILVQAQVGDATVKITGQDAQHVAAVPSQSFATLSGTGLLTFRAGSNGADLYLLMLYSRLPDGQDLAVSGNEASSRILGYYDNSTRSSGISGQGVPANTPVTLSLAMPTGSDAPETFGGDQTLVFVAPLADPLIVTPSDGALLRGPFDPHVTAPTTPISSPTTIAPAGSAAALPGNRFHAAPANDPASAFLVAQVESIGLSDQGANATPSGVSTPIDLTGLTPAQTALTLNFTNTSPLTTELYRLDLNADISWDITPGPNGPLAVLAYATSGSATLTTSGATPVLVDSTSSDTSAGSVVGDGATVTTGAQATTLDLAIIGHGPQNFDLVNVPGQVTILGVSPDSSLVQAAGNCSTTEPVALYMGVRQSYDGKIERFAPDPGTIMMQVLSGNALVTREAGEVVISQPAADQAGATPNALTPGSSLTARSGEAFLLTAQGDPLTYLILSVVPGQSPTSANATAAGTPAIGTSCDATPETRAGFRGDSA